MVGRGSLSPPHREGRLGASYGTQFGASLPAPPQFGGGLPTPPRFGEGLPTPPPRDRRSPGLGRPSVGRVARSETGHNAWSQPRFGAGLRFARVSRPRHHPTEGLRGLGDLRSAVWLGLRPATTRGRSRGSARVLGCGAGLPTPPPPDRRSPGLGRPSVGRVARSETGHNAWSQPSHNAWSQPGHNASPATTRPVALLLLVLPLLGAMAAQAARAGTDNQAAAVESRLAETTRFLASDACEGRGLGSRGINLAADYIAARFRQYGLKTDLWQGGPFQKFQVAIDARPGPDNHLTLLGPATPGAASPGHAAGVGQGFHPPGHQRRRQFRSAPGLCRLRDYGPQRPLRRLRRPGRIGQGGDRAARRSPGRRRRPRRRPAGQVPPSLSSTTRLPTPTSRARRP